MKAVKIILAALLCISLVTGSILFYISRPVEVDTNAVSEVPVNPNATENTKKLMEYLANGYGKVVLSGQYINTFDDFSKEKFLTRIEDKTSWNIFKTDEMQAVHSITNDYPLILGLDVTLLAQGTDQATIDFAKQWHDAGGIVTMCWHWVAPNREGDKKSFYTKQTDFDLKKALADKESEDYKAIVSDIDKLCEALKPLAEEDIPILWRPLHEASGGWFWWGASGKDSYRELYNLLYDRMTNIHGLNNLIWVSNSQNPSWYVGDEKCDIIGDDPYYPQSSRFFYEHNPANLSRFKKCLKSSENKIIMMSENEYLPNIDSAFEKGACWLTFATWCREYVCVLDDNGYTTPEYSEKYAAKDEVKRTYDDERVITLNKKESIDRSDYS